MAKKRDLTPPAAAESSSSSSSSSDDDDDQEESSSDEEQEQPPPVSKPLPPKVPQVVVPDSHESKSESESDEEEGEAVGPTPLATINHSQPDKKPSSDEDEDEDEDEAKGPTPLATANGSQPDGKRRKLSAPPDHSLSMKPEEKVLKTKVGDVGTKGHAAHGSRPCNLFLKRFIRELINNQEAVTRDVEGTVMRLEEQKAQEFDAELKNLSVANWKLKAREMELKAKVLELLEKKM